jgi:predicted dehydrogenase
MRVIVVGAGSISREYALQHFQSAETATKVVAIVDLDSALAQSLAVDVGAAAAGAAVVMEGEECIPSAPEYVEFSVVVCVCVCVCLCL